jgi:hypothetical protein
MDAKPNNNGGLEARLSASSSPGREARDARSKVGTREQMDSRRGRRTQGVQPARQMLQQGRRVAHLLYSGEPPNLIRGIKNFARREPVLFLGGCLVAGAVISRFLKAVSRHEHLGNPDSRIWDRSGANRQHDSVGNLGSNVPIRETEPRGPLDQSGLGASAAPFDVRPKLPETPPDLGGGV